MTTKYLKIAVYGSLKKGFWNHDRFLSNEKYLGSDTVKGKMQMSFGGYPYLFEGDGLDYPIEIYEVSEDIYYGIRGMELGAGYYEKSISTKYGGVTIFYASLSFYKEDKPIIKEYVNR